jgi:hypothetical protein
MRQLSARKKRVSSLLGAGALLVGGVATPALLAAAPASATTCTVGVACTVTGTAALTGGTLSITPPPAIGWTGTLTGVTKDLVDLTAADETYNVDDATGATSGWNVSLTATPFTSTIPTSAVLPNAGTFSTDGSLTTATGATAPTATCTSGPGTCVLPTDGVTYPIAITTAATPSPTTTYIIYNAADSTGVGSIDIGGATALNPVGWWLAVSPTTAPGTYTSTVTFTLASGPGTLPQSAPHAIARVYLSARNLLRYTRRAHGQGLDRIGIHLPVRLAKLDHW